MGLLCPGEVIHQIGQQGARAGEEEVKGFHMRYVLHIVTRGDTRACVFSSSAGSRHCPVVCTVYHKQRNFTREKYRKCGEIFSTSVHLSFLWSGLPGSCVLACQNFIKVVVFKGYPYFSFVKGALFFPNSPQSPKILNEICYFHRKACPVLVDFGGDSCIMIDRRIRIRISSSAARPPFWLRGGQRV